jgi:hypothetical protein
MLSSVLKIFFGMVLLVSIVMPIYSVNSALQMTVHNQYEERFVRLKSSGRSDTPSLFGLNASELAGLPRETAEAYEHAVRDGYRLGHGYSALWSQSMALDGLLFVSGILGLWSCRLRRQSPNQTMQRTAGRLDS